MAKRFCDLLHCADFDMIERKRRKMIPDYLDHIGGNNAQGKFISSFCFGKFKLSAWLQNETRRPRTKLWPSVAKQCLPTYHKLSPPGQGRLANKMLLQSTFIRRCFCLRNLMDYTHIFLGWYLSPWFSLRWPLLTQFWVSFHLLGA